MVSELFVGNQYVAPHIEIGIRRREFPKIYLFEASAPNHFLKLLLAIKIGLVKQCDQEIIYKMLP